MHAPLRHPDAGQTGRPSRREALTSLGAFALAGTTPWLAACGGGLDELGPPQIHRFEASAGAVFVGDTVRLRVDYGGGTGRIEPGIGPVARGSEVASPALGADTTFRLVVERDGQPAASRGLTVAVRYRDRYATTAGSAAMAQHTAVPLADGSVLLIGGSRGENTLAFAVDRLDPASGRVTRLGQLAQGRAAASALLLADGRVLVAGGEASTDGRAVELIDPRNGAISPAGTLSVTRSEHAAVRLANGAVLLLGGVTTGEGNPLGLSRSAELWEPATQRFRRLADSMTMARAGHSATLLPDGRVLVAGGYTTAASYTFAELFDPATERFTPLPDALPLRANHVALAGADGRVLLLGGETVQGSAVDPLPVATVLRFDPASGRFAALPDLLAPRTVARGVMLPAGDVLLFGGERTAGAATSSAERYAAGTGGRAIAPLDRARAGHSATRLPDGRIAIVGGAVGLDFADAILLYE